MSGISRPSSRTATNEQDRTQMVYASSSGATTSVAASSLSPSTTSSANAQMKTVDDENASLNPPRGRPNARYPASLGRVPLHRRGTSKTYERLEDLLREAGYKETRIFTPESERADQEAEERNARERASGSMRGGVGAVVDFLAGLVSRTSSLSREASGPCSNPQRETEELSPPPSPLSHIQQRVKHLHPSSAYLSAYHPNVSSESLLRSPPKTHSNIAVNALVASRPTTPSPLHNETGIQHQYSSHLPHCHHVHVRHRPRPGPSTSHLTPSHPGVHAPKARAYLRHMASAPHIQPLSKRLSSSDTSLHSHVRANNYEHRRRRSYVLNQRGLEDSGLRRDDTGQDPPLPRTWLETVARAVLFGGPGAYIGGPLEATAASTGSVRGGSYVLSKDSAGGRAPVLLQQMYGRRSVTTQGTVSCTSVVCRSAPTSRASSRTRIRSYDSDTGKRRASHHAKRKERNAAGKTAQGKGKKRESAAVPSLARTTVENDDWRRINRHFSDWGTETSTVSVADEAISSDESDEEDDDDEEDEVDLDRLLVPSKRQHSIRSLRKHLQGSANTNSSQTRRRKWPARSRWTVGDGTDGDEDEHRDWSWRSRSWSRRPLPEGSGDAIDEEGYGYGVSAGTGNGVAPKKRGGIPGPWAQAL